MFSLHFWFSIVEWSFFLELLSAGRLLCCLFPLPYPSAGTTSSTMYSPRYATSVGYCAAYRAYRRGGYRVRRCNLHCRGGGAGEGGQSSLVNADRSPVRYPLTWSR
jgi:hypothetical protein